MLFRAAKGPLVGLDIGSSSVKIVQLKQSAKGYALERFGIRWLDPELIVDGTVMDSGRVVEAIKGLLEEQKVKSREVALSVSGHSVIVKKISLPPMSEEELEESIKWEAEQYIPFDINDVNLDFHILGSGEALEGREQMSVLVVAAKKDKLTEYTSLVAEAGLTPVVVDVDAFTIENMFSVNYDTRPDEVVALVNVGASVMNINVLKGGLSSFTRDVNVGGNRYTETLQRECALSYEQAEQAKRGEAVEAGPEGTPPDPEAVKRILQSVHAEIAAEVARTLDYFKTTSMQERIDRVIFSGGVAKMVDCVQFLGERLASPVEVANPFARVEIVKGIDRDYIAEMAPLAAVGFGLALRKVGDR